MRMKRICLIGLLFPLSAFAQNPEILVNSRGLAQHDLSIRGSGYTGTGISINGLNLKVPYSAHFNAELPMVGTLFSDPMALSGLGNASGHLVGTAAYTTVPQTPYVQTGAEIGTRERMQATLSSFGANGGGFLDWEKAKRIDYEANELDRLSGGVNIQFPADDWLFDVMAAGQTKDFGAQGYYGLPAAVDADERTDDSLLFFGASKGGLDGAYFRTSAAVREFDDQYRIPSAAFSSNTRSQFGAVALEGRTIEIQDIALFVRGDIEHERVGGDIGNQKRTRGSILLLPEARLGSLEIKAGINSVFQTSESADWLPLAGIDWFANDNSVFFASYTETVQQPDYQTLYFSDGLYRIGNDQLRQQRSRNSELGFRQFISASLDWRIGGFFRRLENASDWTQASAGGTWKATDLGTLDAMGVDTGLHFQPSENLILKAYYQWLTKESVDVYAGLYELDYPEHLLNLSAYWKFLGEYAFEFAQTTRYQTANNARDGSDFGAEASLGLHWFPRFAKNVRLSFLVDNLWGTDFQAIPGLKPRPTSVSTGITVNW